MSIGDDELHVQDWLIQPVAADTVADVLSEAACSSARPSTRTVTGPEVIRLPELTSRLLEHHGDHRPVRTTTPPLPGFSDGQLVAPGDAAVVGPDVDAWLQTASAHNTWLKTI